MGYSYHRVVIQPDPIIGYQFIPNIYPRISRGNSAFVIQTNEQGFWNNCSLNNMNDGSLNVLALGNSCLAGDGISNHERFTDINAERLN